MSVVRSVNSPGKTIPSNCFHLAGVSVTDSGRDCFHVMDVCVPGPPLKLISHHVIWPGEHLAPMQFLLICPGF